MTIPFLESVRGGDIWTPMGVGENRAIIKPCLNPPPLDTILFELRNVNVDLGITSKNKPNLEYALLCLSTLKPDHPFFKKNYRYQKPKPGLNFTKIVDNTDGFFYDSIKSKAKRRSIKIKYFAPPLTLEEKVNEVENLRN